MIIIIGLTKLQVVTIFNGTLSVIQYTLPLGLVVMAVFSLHDVYPSIGWNSVASTIHSSIWPILLRSDSASHKGLDLRVAAISYAILFGALTGAIAGIVTPLGISGGPMVARKSMVKQTSYVADTSSFGNETTPRGFEIYGRLCDDFACPGSNNLDNSTSFSQSIIETFSSTPYGPFNMHFRQYSKSPFLNVDFTVGRRAIIESHIIRDEIFAVEGLVVDMTKNSGVGFWNHTFPNSPKGGSWSHSILWVEPVSACVDTNLTVDYDLTTVDVIESYDITDRGGWANIAEKEPPRPKNGQDINLYDNANYAAWYAAIGSMMSFNISRGQSFVGNSIPVDTSKQSSLFPTLVGSVFLDKVSGLWNQTLFDVDPTIRNTSISLEQTCRGYDSNTQASIYTAGVHCALLFGPPERSDGTLSNLPVANSRWSQKIYSCAAATRASMQNVEFTFDGVQDLSHVKVSRAPVDSPVLWAAEQTKLGVGHIDILWGRVTEDLRSDPSLSIVYNPKLWIPANRGDDSAILLDGMPQTTPGIVLAEIMSPSLWITSGNLYSGNTRQSLIARLRGLVRDDPENGPAQIINLIWTDQISSALVGSDSAVSTMFIENVPSIEFSLLYGIPCFLVWFIWFISIVSMLWVLVVKKIRPTHIRIFLSETSVGKLVTGKSVLRPVEVNASLLDLSVNGSHLTRDRNATMRGDSVVSHLRTKQWAEGLGKQPISFNNPSTGLDPPAQSSDHYGALSEELMHIEKNSALSSHL